MFWCGFFVWYVLNYDLLKDYCLYVVGFNFFVKICDGRVGKYVNMMIYKNVKIGKKCEYDVVSKEFFDFKIWEQEDMWKYDLMINKEIFVFIFFMIDINQFNLILLVFGVIKYELKLLFVVD